MHMSIIVRTVLSMFLSLDCHSQDTNDSNVEKFSIEKLADFKSGTVLSLDFAYRTIMIDQKEFMLDDHFCKSYQKIILQ